MKIASTLFKRLVGLINKKACCNEEVLLLIPCRSIHTFGMKESIDVAFIDAGGKVLKAVSAMPPRSFCSCSGAAAALERRSTNDMSGANSANSDPWFEVGDVVKIASEISRMDG